MDILDHEDVRTVWCGNLSEKVTEELLYELFLQAGPLEKVRIPRDRDGRQSSFSFITFKHQCSVGYALNLMQGIRLFGRDIKLEPRNYASPEMSNISYDNLLLMGSQVSLCNSQQNYPSNMKTDYYRGESLQGRWANSHGRDKNLKPNYHKREYKRHRH